MEEGVDCEAGDALDACFAHDVLAVGGDGEDAHVEACGNFFVRQAFCHFDEHCRLATSEFVATHGVVVGFCAEVKDCLPYRHLCNRPV